MTSATEELRRMLDERGVEWRGGLPTETMVEADGLDLLYVALPDGRVRAFIRNYLTPEQAIEATLGQKVTGQTSDGYHTFDELYHHRAVLFSVIVRDHRELAWKSMRHHDGTMYDGMFIVGIETPQGQATYHYDIDPYWDMFDCRELERAPEWDGHSPADAIERIATLGGDLQVIYENMKLRELVRDMVLNMGGCALHGNPLRLREFGNRAKELGVEVDE